MNVLPKRAGRLLRSVLVAAAAAILLWTLILMIFEEQFIYFPTKYPSGYHNVNREVLNVEDCWFTTEDGLQLHGWFLPSEKAIATLVMAHGNAGNLSHRYAILRALQQQGFNVFMFDYRGYGRSEGSPTEEGVYRDGRAAFDYVRQRGDVDPARIILFGTSLGGAVVVDVAIHRPAAALILESTFTSAREMATTLYPFLPVQFVLRSRFDSVDKIPRIRIPVLSLHGNQDEIIPFQLGQKLFAAANGPKEFYEISGAHHNDTFYIGGEEYLDNIRQFAIRHVRSTSR